MILDGTFWHIKTDDSYNNNSTYRAKRSLISKKDMTDYIQKMKRGSSNLNI